MLRNKKNKLLTKPVFILTIIIAAIVVVFAVIIIKMQPKQVTTPSESMPETNTKINLDPPTNQELSETAAHKDKLSNENQDSNTNTFGKTKVTPVITSVNQSELRAYVSGIVEDGGICKATFKKGSTSFTKESSGFGNVNTTNCSVIQLSRSDFASAGEWTVTVEYTSNNSSGTSQPATFGVE